MLALLTIKDYVYGAIIAAILAFLGWFAMHERAVVAAADKAVAQHQLIREEKQSGAAAVQVVKDEATYTAAVAAPTLPAPRVVCVTAAPGPRAVPAHAGPASGGDGAVAVPTEATGPVHSFDPAPGALQVGRDADAQVALLQAYVKDCQARGFCAK